MIIAALYSITVLHRSTILCCRSAVVVHLAPCLASGAASCIMDLTKLKKEKKKKKEGKKKKSPKATVQLLKLQHFK